VKIFPGNDPEYWFWTPEADDMVLVGPEQRQVPLPQMPLPIRVQFLQGEERPSDDNIGLSVYDYLRRYPDAEGASWLAALLRDAFPHYLADIASQIIMLDEKEVDAAYIRRKINGLKFLALLEPQPQLLYLLGRAWFDLGIMFTELAACRLHFSAAGDALRRALVLQPGNPAALNLLGQIACWRGEISEARRCWEETVALLPDGPARSALQNRLTFLAEGPESAPPLVDDLERLGEVLPLIGDGDFRSALAILEELETEGRVCRELPMPEFYYLLGYCREMSGDSKEALIAYSRALEIDPEHAASLEGFARIGEGRSQDVR